MLRERLVGRLGDPEVNHLRHRLPIEQGDEDVRGLQIPVDDPFLVSVLHSLADRHEQLQSLPRGQLVLVTKLREWHPRHVLHCKERPAVLRHPRFKDLGHIGMRKHRQCLPLGVEPRHNLPGVHPQLDDLQRHNAANWLPLLGLINNPHPTFADLFEDAEGADLLRFLVGGTTLRRFARRRVDRLLHRRNLVWLTFGHLLYS